MPETVENVAVRCESCERESRHVIKRMGADNRAHYVCWSCLYREEKRINLKESWRRGGRVR